MMELLEARTTEDPDQISLPLTSPQALLAPGGAITTFKRSKPEIEGYRSESVVTAFAK
jgi:hypothetical protein